MEEILDILDSKMREMEDITEEEMQDYNFTEDFVKGYVEAMRQAIEIIESEVE